MLVSGNLFSRHKKFINFPLEIKISSLKAAIRNKDSVLCELASNPSLPIKEWRAAYSFTKIPPKLLQQGEKDLVLQWSEESKISYSLVHYQVALISVSKFSMRYAEKLF